MKVEEKLLQGRDTKAIPHLEQYAPVWIVDEQAMPHEEAVQFNVVFQHNLYGWVNRRYRYDDFNKVLYYKGQTLASPEQMQEIQEKEPYIAPVVEDVPNAYGG